MKAIATIFAALVLSALIVVPLATSQEAPDPTYAALEERVATLEAAALPSSPFLHTCNMAAQLAAIGNVSITRCRKISVIEEGNFALVTVKVWVSGQGTFIVREALQKSVWNQSALDVQPG